MKKTQYSRSGSKIKQERPAAKTAKQHKGKARAGRVLEDYTPQQPALSAVVPGAVAGVNPLQRVMDDDLRRQMASYCEESLLINPGGAAGNYNLAISAEAEVRAHLLASYSHLPTTPACAQGDLSKAIEHYKLALVSDSCDADTHYGLANVLERVAETQMGFLQAAQHYGYAADIYQIRFGEGCLEANDARCHALGMKEQARLCLQI